LFKAMADLPVTPLVGNGDQLIQPIHISDLSHAVLNLIQSNTICRQRIEAVGPEPVSLKQLLSVLKYWLGVTHERFLPIPYWVALFAAQLTGLSGKTLFNADALKMLQAGNTASVQPFINNFGFTPASMRQALLRQPMLESDRLDAKLYFLIPLLRFTLAMLWIASGLISAFAYPVEASYTMLVQVGIPNTLAPVALYAASTVDVCLGVALLFSYHIRSVLFLQIAAMLIYSAVITASMPDLWIHPFGPVTKNIPLLVATLVLLAEEK
jgi:hypothetical protein